MQYKLSFSIVMLILFGITSAEASKFRLKNVPEQYALIEGAIVKKDSQTIVIMTKTGLTIRDINSIEILEETPSDDKKFIDTYGSTNQEYQRYLKPNQTRTETIQPSKETHGYKSVAKPGETFDLQYKFQEKKLSYYDVDMVMELHSTAYEQDIPMKINLNIVFQAYIKELDRIGNGVFFIKPDIKSAEMDILGNTRRIPISTFESVDTEELTFSPKGELIINAKGEKINPEQRLAKWAELESFKLFSTFSDKIVKVGERWDFETGYTDPNSKNGLVEEFSILTDVVDMDGNKTGIIETNLVMTAKNQNYTSIKTLEPLIPQNQRPKKDDTNIKMDVEVTRKLIDFFNLETQTSSKLIETTSLKMEIRNPEKEEPLSVTLFTNSKISLSDKNPR